MRTFVFLCNLDLTSIQTWPRVCFSINGWRHDCNFYMILHHKFIKNNKVHKNSIYILSYQQMWWCNSTFSKYTLPRHAAVFIVVLGASGLISSNNHPIPWTLSPSPNFCYELEDLWCIFTKFCHGLKGANLLWIRRRIFS